jgi:Fe2+ transport system protein B
MNMFKITAEVRGILIASEDITKLIGRKVFSIVADENTDGDFIVYQRDGYKQDSTKYGISLQTPIVFVSAVSADYERSIELASLIYDTLSGEFSNPDMHIQLEDSTEDFIDNKFIQVLQFSIRQN